MESLNELIVKYHERNYRMFRSYLFAVMFGSFDVNFERICHLENIFKERLRRAIAHRDKFEHIDIGGSE